MRRLLIAALTLGALIVPSVNANAGNPNDLIPGRTIIWTSRGGVDHLCVIIKKNDPVLDGLDGIPNDPGIFVCELVEFPGAYITITAGPTRVPVGG